VHKKRSNPSDQRGACCLFAVGARLICPQIDTRTPLSGVATLSISDNFLPAYTIAVQSVVCRKLPSPKRFLMLVVVLEIQPLQYGTGATFQILSAQCSTLWRRLQCPLRKETNPGERPRLVANLGKRAIRAMPLLRRCFSNILFYRAKIILPTERGRTPG